MLKMRLSVEQISAGMCSAPFPLLSVEEIYAVDEVTHFLFMELCLIHLSFTFCLSHFFFICFSPLILISLHSLSLAYSVSQKTHVHCRLLENMEY